MSARAPLSPEPAQRTMRIGSVSYLNAKPLIWGLESAPDIELSLDVPAGLLDGLRDGRHDVALLPVIDFQRMQGLRIVPAGGIGCDGSTLTVRLFSGRPIEQIRTLACDIESHTSVALARIIFAERFGTRPEFIDLADECGHRCDGKLLIGDKVVCDEPAGLDYQLDLGRAWKELTGLPFVFAVWTARQGIDLGDLPRRLRQAWRNGLDHVEEIIRHYALPRGWPAGVALQYLTLYLKYEVGRTQLRAIRHFHRLAARHGIIPHKPWPLALYRAARPAPIA